MCCRCPHRACAHCMRPSGCSEVTWLPQGSAAIGHRYRQHPAEATTEAAGVIPESQERFVALFVYLHFILVYIYFHCYY